MPSSETIRRQPLSSVAIASSERISYRGIRFTNIVLLLSDVLDRRGLLDSDVELLFHVNHERCDARTGTRPSTAPRSCSCAWSRARRPLGVGELADATRAAEEHHLAARSRALERQGLVQRDGDRAPPAPGPGAPPLRPAAERRRRPGRARRPSARRGWPQSPARRSTSASRRRSASTSSPSVDSRSLPRLDELGRPARPVPRHGDRQGFLAWGAVPCRPARGARRHDHRPRGARGELARAPRGYATAVDELELGPGRARRARVRGARGAWSRRSRISGPDDPPHAASASTSWRPLLVAAGARPLRAARPPTTSEVPHDPRRDPPGPLRPDAGRQRARGAGAVEPGPRATGIGPESMLSTR